MIDGRVSKLSCASCVDGWERFGRKDEDEGDDMPARDTTAA